MSSNAKIQIDGNFSKGEDPYKTINWTKTDAQITNEQGEVLFLQKGVEAPSFYSELARKVIASRYFYGERNSNERESSVRQLVGRVAETIAYWGLKQGYFTELSSKMYHYELARLDFDQMVSFNSPVYFNVGTDRYPSRKTKDTRLEYIIADKDTTMSLSFNGKTAEIPIKKGEVIIVPYGQNHLYPQTSACFINSVEDNMESIMELAATEAFLFRHGSGTGTDLSTLRSSREGLSGGGKPSGPLAYEVFYDKVAGIVKSGGKTRRAAKMNSLRVDHPDIMEFITAKMEQEVLVNALMDYAGYDWKKARENVHFQNANFSIRIPDEFMNAVKNNLEWQTIPVHSKEMADKMPKYKARDLFRKIAEGTRACGDPGIQYDTTINKWHTCPNSGTGRINASNPCSEYMFVDNSSCNLASLNLMSFINPDGSFNVDDFGNAIRILTIGQDILYDNSSFPKIEIAENSHKFRPLGMGYANLGSLLMFLGLPYDSNEGRATAAAITSLLTAKVYETSTELAEKIGAFEEFEKNKEPMMKVMRMHKESLKNIDRNKLLKGLEKILDLSEKTWENVIGRGELYGFRNAQATVLAPTGTIGFKMDCATTGIEPDIALVKYKLLAEGGQLKIINYTVQPALQRLGYTEEQIKSIIDYIEKNDTIEGSILKEEHLPIFDCAFKPKKGKRNIDAMGHIKMMAAVQPFLSGAISKTININKEVNVEEIERLYMAAWELGLKAVAIYRDGSKRYQPLSVEDSKSDLEKRISAMGKPFRRKLPTTRPSITHKFNVAGHEGYLTVGLYEDSTPGELFITMSKEGSTIGGLMDTIGTLTSFALQYGIPLKDLVNKLRNNRFEPYGMVFEGDENIKTVCSLTDYIYSWMAKQFNCDIKPNPTAYDDEHEENNAGAFADAIAKSINLVSNTSVLEPKIKNSLKISGEPGGFCIICGSQMYKFGHCEERCPKEGCGHIEYNGCGK